ncbi:MAG: transposase family protein [Chloroflexi bacterium]|nr:transposase family protein [Chloroflexota bacterium]
MVKKRHGVKNNVLVDMLCKIRFLSDTVEGKKHDKKLADETDYTLPEGSKLCQDTGFQGFTLENVAILQPKKKPKGKSLSDLDKSINQWHSSLRVRVEHAIGGVKRYRIVKDKIRNWKPGFKDTVFETCCGLHNFRLNFRPWTYKPIQLHLFVNF